MDHDSHRSLVQFDADYWNLVERSFCVAQSFEHSTGATARPQGSGRKSAEHYRSKFEAMEREFREEFGVTSRAPATTDDESNSAGRPAQVFML